MIKENIFDVKGRIASACSRAGRELSSVTFVCVAKGRPAGDIREAIASGIADIGESRVQEATLKYKELQTPDSKLPAIRWHMIGHLQTNKAKEAVRIFDLIQSVDTIRLALEIDKQAALVNKVQDILIEVNISGEEQKYGFSPADMPAAIKQISSFKNIGINGLMAVGPLGGDIERARSCFRQLRELRDGFNRLRTANSALHTLSMGMSDDFEAAIEEGSSMVRIGGAVFGRIDGE